MKKTFAALSILGVIASSLEAATVAKWTFEASVPSSTGSSISGLAAEEGSGSASAFHTSALTIYSNPAGNGSAESFSADKWAIEDYWQFQTSTVGFTNISISYDQTSSSTGPRDFALSYSVNGSSFTAIGGTYAVLQNGLAPNASWTIGTSVPAYGFSVSLFGIGAAEEAPSLFFRIKDMSAVTPSGGAVAATGTSRIDNFVVSGVSSVTLVPEPATWALFGAGVIGLGFVVRRKNK